MSEPQSADLKVTLNGIVIQVGSHEILISEHAARQLLQALPALLKALEAIRLVNPKPDEKIKCYL